MWYERDAKAHLAVVAIHLVLQICDLYVLGLELGHDLVGLGVRLSVVVPISYNNVLAPRTTPPWPFDSGHAVVGLGIRRRARARASASDTGMGVVRRHAQRRVCSMCVGMAIGTCAVGTIDRGVYGVSVDD